jgi:hypothetical protein
MAPVVLIAMRGETDPMRTAAPSMGCLLLVPEKAIVIIDTSPG